MGVRGPTKIGDSAGLKPWREALLHAIPLAPLGPAPADFAPVS